jgi:hypothetical protein
MFSGSLRRRPGGMTQDSQDSGDGGGGDALAELQAWMRAWAYCS